MDTKVIKIDENNIDSLAINEAGEILKSGGLVAFPTETVYGLGGDALNPDSSKKIYAAKGRPSDNPLIVHISDMKALVPIVSDIPADAVKLAEAFWPGPLTMIFRKSQLVPKETTGGLDTVAVRMPSNKIAAALITAAGGYIAAPSANRSGRPSTTEASHVIQDMDGRIDMIIDGGESDVGLESTIVDLTEEAPVILRPGFITKEDLERALDKPVSFDRAIIDENSKEPPKAPGMKYKHYAPKGELFIVEGAPSKVIEKISELTLRYEEEGHKVGVIASLENAGAYERGTVKTIGSFSDEKEVAHNLFKILREFDDEEVDIMFSESFNGAGVCVAIMNRLLKAAGHRILSAD